MSVETKNRYIEAVGRRKTAIARVRITPSTKNSFVVNDKDVKEYFVTNDLQVLAQEALNKSEIGEKFTVTVRVQGGGIHAQAEAVRHGLARTLVERRTVSTPWSQKFLAPLIHLNICKLRRVSAKNIKTLSSDRVFIFLALTPADPVDQEVWL